MSTVIGNCSRHPGFNMINCPLCEIETQNMISKEIIVSDNLRRKGITTPNNSVKSLSLCAGAIKEVVPFLKKNGFKKTDTKLYANDYCSVEFQENGYAVCDNEGWAMYSDDFNIYWLIGVLTWRGFMDKNYIK